MLRIEPNNLKAHFRRAQLLGRAGDYEEARAALESLCRRQPNERSFRTELASLTAQAQKARQETASFWSAAAKRTFAERALDGLESGSEAERDGPASPRSSPLLRAQTAFCAIFQWCLQLFRRLRIQLRGVAADDAEQLAAGRDHVL